MTDYDHEGNDGVPKQGYEKKFATFIKMLDENKGKVDAVVVSHPQVLGDDYEELVESLNRMAESGLALRIAGRR